jgi:hypothetical protein
MAKYLTGWFVAWPNRLEDEIPAATSIFNFRGWGEIIGQLDAGLLVQVMTRDAGEPPFAACVPLFLPGLVFFARKIDLDEYHAYWTQEHDE